MLSIACQSVERAQGVQGDVARYIDVIEVIMDMRQRRVHAGISDALCIGCKAHLRRRPRL